MKSAYELAMERLQQQAPSNPLTDVQREALAEADSRYQSRIAEKEVFLGGLIAKARSAGNAQEAAELQEQLRRERRGLEQDREDAKERIRKGT